MGGGTYRTSFDDDSNAPETEVLGGTDQTKIGNVGDRLKVDTVISPSNGTIPSIGPSLRYLDMGTAYGGVAADTVVDATAWVDVYSYSGSGLLFGWLLNLENDDHWQIRFIVDGEEVFDTNGLFSFNLVDDRKWDLDSGGKAITPNESRLGISEEEHDRIVWTAPASFPIRYTSSVVIKVKRETGESSRKWRAGLMVSTRES